jgi:hypothetical protein
MIAQGLKIAQDEGARGIMIVPYWPTQPWFLRFFAMCDIVLLVLGSRDQSREITPF